MRIFGLLTAGALLVAADAPKSELPNWMLGAWIERSGDSWAEEYWTGARAGLQLGSSRTGKGETLKNWEFARIEAGKDGRLAYIVSPQGGPWVTFHAVENGDRSITFENATNDYPTRIRYWREGDGLNAEISGPGGANAMRWTYRPMR